MASAKLRTVDRHRLQTLLGQPPDRIYTESRVLSYASACARLGDFQDNSGEAADEKRKRTLEHAPRD